nr:protein TIC 40, chloroplastic [Ipomoea batatas]
MTVEALEKMMEDPTVQKMVYPYLPDEMRNPETFKWMLQNPHYRQQLQDMLNNMGGSPEWDNRMMDTLKNFDLSSPEVKQQFGRLEPLYVKGVIFFILLQLYILSNQHIWNTSR